MRLLHFLVMLAFKIKKYQDLCNPSSTLPQHKCFQACECGEQLCLFHELPDCPAVFCTREVGHGCRPRGTLVARLTATSHSLQDSPHLVLNARFRAVRRSKLGGESGFTWQDKGAKPTREHLTSDRRSKLALQKHTLSCRCSPLAGR